MKSWAKDTKSIKRKNRDILLHKIEFQEKILNNLRKKYKIYDNEKLKVIQVLNNQNLNYSKKK